MILMHLCKDFSNFLQAAFEGIELQVSDAASPDRDGGAKSENAALPEIKEEPQLGDTIDNTLSIEPKGREEESEESVLDETERKREVIEKNKEEGAIEEATHINLITKDADSDNENDANNTSFNVMVSVN